jgi:hypothetical protein
MIIIISKIFPFPQNMSQRFDAAKIMNNKAPGNPITIAGKAILQPPVTEDGYHRLDQGIQIRRTDFAQLNKAQKAFLTGTFPTKDAEIRIKAADVLGPIIQNLPISPEEVIIATTANYNQWGGE